MQNLTVYQDANVGKDFDDLNSDGIQTHIDQYTYGYDADIIWTDKDTSTYGGYGEMAVTHANRKFNNIYMFIYNDSIFI